jgi:O-antigen ligase
MRIPPAYHGRLLSATLLLMWVGLFYSRALLSIALVAFIAASVGSVPLRELTASLRSHAYLWTMALLFLIPFITGLWSGDLGEWAGRMLDKSPLLLIPLCSPSLCRISETDRRRLLWICLAVAMTSVCGTTLRYLLDRTGVDASYLRAKVMTVDMDDDHVRYGWVLSGIYAWLLHLVASNGLPDRLQRNAATGCLAVVAAFLHLLSSRTGLMGLYLSTVIVVAFHRRKALAKSLAAFLLLAPATAWWLLPTFRNRVRFGIWDFQNLSRGGYVEGLSDTPRHLSLKVGAKIAKEHPWLGTGFGDIKRAMWDGYAHHHPYLKDYEKLLPSNEFLFHAAAAGWPASAAFTAVVLTPLLLKGFRSHAGWVCLHAIALAGCLYEIGLETQYGIFVYALPGCLAYLHIRAGQAGEREGRDTRDGDAPKPPLGKYA